MRGAPCSLLGYFPARRWATLALALLAVTGGIAWHFLQDQLAKSAVTALASLYGTKFKYGSIIKTICKWVHGLWGGTGRKLSRLFLPDAVFLLEEAARGVPRSGSMGEDNSPRRCLGEQWGPFLK